MTTAMYPSFSAEIRTPRIRPPDVRTPGPSDAAARLRAAGLRPSRARCRILAAIDEFGTGADVEVIVAHARRDSPRISRATVYRFLAALRRRSLT
jgi:Fe2+ or Zn2+ uptake regulation protein